MVAVVVVVAALYLLSSSSGRYNVAVQMTDPPTVPAGTQALVISYSSVAVHVSGSNQSGWVSATGSGNVNIMAVTNVSQMIANAKVAANSTVNIVRFNVTSARITINGATYNVTLPNNQVTVAVTGGQKINSSTAVLIDFYPTVNAQGSANGTVYMMVPAAKAIAISGNSTVSINANIGSTASINANVRAMLGLGGGGATYGTPVAVGDGARVSNFLVQNISYSLGAVSGLLYMEYPLASNVGANTTLHVNSTVGYACDNSEFVLTAIYSNGTAAFTPLLNTKTNAGCPV